MYRPTTRGLPMQIYLFALYSVLYFYFVYLSPGRLIKKIGRDVVDRDFIYFCSSIFSYLWGMFYCAQDIDA